MSFSCLSIVMRVMPEISHNPEAVEAPPFSVQSEVPAAENQKRAWTYPLDEFYSRARLALPGIEVVTGADIPEPYRGLLVHENDMTPTLSAFYARIIHLRVLSRHQRDGHYSREVVLLADGREAP